MWVRIPLETYIFILNFSLPPRSEQVNRAVANEIKHVHSPEVIVVLDPRYDLSYTALYISTCSIALSKCKCSFPIQRWLRCVIAYIMLTCSRFFQDCRPRTAPIIGKRSIQTCKACCKGDHCNVDLCDGHNRGNKYLNKWLIS